MYGIFDNSLSAYLLCREHFINTWNNSNNMHLYLPSLPCYDVNGIQNSLSARTSFLFLAANMVSFWRAHFFTLSHYMADTWFHNDLLKYSLFSSFVNFTDFATHDVDKSYMPSLIEASDKSTMCRAIAKNNSYKLNSCWFRMRINDKANFNLENWLDGNFGQRQL